MDRRFKEEFVEEGDVGKELRRQVRTVHEDVDLCGKVCEILKYT